MLDRYAVTSGKQIQRLILHVGVHKTGSSSIQESLATGLESQDTEYLSFGRPNGSLAFSRAFSSTFTKRPMFRNRVLSSDDLSEIRKLGYREIRKTLTAARQQTCIVSAEDICNFNSGDLEKMFSFLRRFANEIQVVAYLREPRSFGESCFQQALKRSAFRLGQQKFKVGQTEQFEKFDRIVGRSNVDIWPFVPSKFPDGNVVIDFCNRLGIPFEKDRSIRSNDGLSLGAVQLLWCYRTIHASAAKEDGAIVAKLSKLSGPKMTFGRELFEQVVDVDWSGLRQLEERLGQPLETKSFEEFPGTVQTVNDLVTPSEETLDWLANETGTARSELKSTEAVASAVASWAGNAG